MPAADRALVRTAIRPGHPWTASPGFHRLSPTADERFRREPVRLAPAASGGLILEAEVRRSPDGFFRIPLPLPDDPGDSSAGGAADLEFRARIEPPSGHRIADAFPSRAETDADGALRIELPAPPSLLRFRVVSSDASAVGLPQLVDGAVLVLLLGLAALGGRRLFAPRGRPPPPAG